MKLRTALVCALGAVMMASAGYLSASAPVLAATCARSSISFVAHEDDSILFQDPEIPREIAAGRCVRTVFVTAGDAGRASSYWLGREAGARAAYARMMSVSNSWTQTDAGVSGHPIPLFISTATPRVSLAFMRLPDGSPTGGGYSPTGFQTLQKLWLGSISSITAVDRTSTYTRPDLISAFRTLTTSVGADRILTQDLVGAFGDGDHSDHHATAYFTRSVSRQDTTAHLLVGYQDYGITNLPVNLSAADSQAKESTFFAYAPNDPYVCQTETACQGQYSSWWHRQYTAGAEFSGLAPSSGGPGTVVTLTGSGFTGASAVSFNGVAAAFTVVSDASLTATVPAGAVTGRITVRTTQGAATSPRPFTVMGVTGSNVAGAATVTASSQNATMGQLAVQAVDGNTDGFGTGDYTDEWATVGQKAGAWLNLQWSTPQTLGAITLFDRPNSNDQITGGTITFSNGSSLAVPPLPNDGSPLTLTFAPRTVTSLRLNITLTSSTTYNVGLAEIQTFTGATASDYSLSGGSSMLVVNQGQATSCTVTVTPTGCFADRVSLGITGLPDGTTATFTPNPTATTSRLTITTSRTTPAGIYALNLTSMSGSLSHTTHVSLIVGRRLVNGSPTGGVRAP